MRLFTKPYFFRYYSGVLALFLLIACAGSGEPPLPSAQRLYQQGNDAIAQGKFFTASEAFNAISDNYPYSEFAPNALLFVAYSEYQRGNYLETISKVNQYRQTYPASPNIAYGLYLKALSYYEQISNIERDQGHTEDAKENFQQLINAYPNSNYSRDAKLKLVLINDSLAGKNLAIGRSYQQRDLCVSAIPRFQYVVENYAETAHVAEALHRLVECSLSLGIKTEAKKYTALLGYNYSKSYWYEKSWDLLQKHQ